MQERRQEPRRKTLLGGRVVFNDRQSTADCVLKNLGASGAKLVFGGTALIPEEFDVQVAHMNTSFRARIVWRVRDEMGVVFVGERPETNIVPLDHAIRIRKLQADKARLEARVAELSLPE